MLKTGKRAQFIMSTCSWSTHLCSNNLYLNFSREECLHKQPTKNVQRISVTLHINVAMDQETVISKLYQKITKLGLGTGNLINFPSWFNNLEVIFCSFFNLKEVQNKTIFLPVKPVPCRVNSRQGKMQVWLPSATKFCSLTSENRRLVVQKLAYM